MSQYVEFFVRSKEGNFTCLDTFSRSTWMYHILSEDIGVPYEKIRKLTPAFLREAMVATTNHIKELEDIKKGAQFRIAAVAKFNNSAQEKAEVVNDICNSLNECEEEINDLQHTYHYLRFFLSMVNTLQYEEGNPALYCGIEVGNPIDKDIVEY